MSEVLLKGSVRKSYCPGMTSRSEFIHALLVLWREAVANCLHRLVPVSKGAAWQSHLYKNVNKLYGQRGSCGGMDDRRRASSTEDLRGGKSSVTVSHTILSSIR